MHAEKHSYVSSTKGAPNLHVDLGATSIQGFNHSQQVCIRWIIISNVQRNNVVVMSQMVAVSFAYLVKGRQLINRWPELFGRYEILRGRCNIFISHKDRHCEQKHCASREINSETAAINSYVRDRMCFIITWRGLRTDIASIFEMLSHTASAIRKASPLARCR